MASLREQFDVQLAELSRQIAPLRARFEALQPREQQLLAAGAVVAGLALLYLAVWEPFAATRERRMHDLAAARDLAGRIELIGAQAQGSRSPGAGPVIGAEVSLLSAVDRASKDGTLGKAPSRMQPDGDKQVRVWVEDVPFDAVVRWMDDLQNRYGLRIDSASVERRPTAGTVNVRLSLVRAP